MRIIECNIDKFGVICNQKFTFSSDLNCILENNGTGKTTLCSFIKAMLYGIGESKKTSLDENDRKKYLPWSGGAAQGSMTFEAGGKIYRVERTFGARPSEDSFAIYDVLLGTKTDDFSEMLGQELFGIDREGFEETVYLSERELSPTGANKSVSAKLSDLVGCDGDIGVMDNAMKILENQRKFLQKKGGAGAIADAKLALKQKQEELSALNGYIGEIATAEKRLSEIDCEIAKIKAERDALIKLEAEAEKQKIYKELEKKQDELLSEIEALTKERDEIIVSLGGVVPEREYIDSLRLEYLASERLASQGNIQNEGADELCALKEIFVGDGADADMSELKDALPDYEEFERAKQTAKYKEIKEAFKKRIPTGEEIEAHLNALTQRKKTSPALPMALLVGAVLALALGFVISPLIFALAAALTASCVAVTVLYRRRALCEAASNEDNALEFISSLSDASPDKGNLLCEILRIKELQKDAVSLLLGDGANAERVVCDILYKYGRHTASPKEGAHALLRDYERYKHLAMREGIREDGARDNKRRAEEIKERVRSEFSRFGLDFKGGFTEIYSSLDRYAELSRLISAKRGEYERYKTDILTSSKGALTPVEGTKEKITALDARSAELNAELGALNQLIARLSSRLEEREEIENDAAQLLEKIKEYSENLEVVLKTRELLTKAKDNIQSKYLGKTESAFSKYIERISGISGEEYRLDTDFNITKSEGGISRHRDAYSRGTRELYNLAVRLALIDSLYEGEMPFIILDDPFAYLDDEKMSGAGAVISALSKGKQIIYLTCVKSRCIKKP